MWMYVDVVAQLVITAVDSKSRGPGLLDTRHGQKENGCLGVCFILPTHPCSPGNIYIYIYNLELDS